MNTVCWLNRKQEGEVYGNVLAGRSPAANLGNAAAPRRNRNSR